MANVINTLYPPIISTFSNAFIYKEDAKVYFGISNYNSVEDIKRVHVSVVNQSNNENALADATGVLFSPLHYDEGKKMYYVTIPVSALASGQFNINRFYKVQIRFDNCYDLKSDDGTVTYDLQNVSSKNNYLLNEQQHFSEWSQVCLIRGIYYPHIYIKAFDMTQSHKTRAFNKGIIPVIGGIFFNADNDATNASNDETETLQSYTVSVLSSDKSKVIKSSKTIYTGDNLNPNDINYRIDLQDTSVSDGDSLVLRVSCTTRNQYSFHKDYDFQIANFDNSVGFAPKIVEMVDNDNGIVKLRITDSKSIIGGTVYVKRMSSEDHFENAELIKSVHMHGALDLTIIDNTVSSLVWYRYSVQYENTAGVLTPITYSKVIVLNFDDAILSRKDKQYSILYNYNVSSYKPVVSRNKIDTLGGRYPRFTENAILNYKQFSISGMISAEADAKQLFVKKSDVYSDTFGSYYDIYKRHPTLSIIDENEQDDYADSNALVDVVRNDFPDYVKYSDTPSGITASDYLTTTKDDWMWERAFRERLVSWLNDGEPKLYRSKQEGTMVVMLTDVSLAPVPNTSRFLYNFSATMYEIEDGTSLEKLDSLGVYDVESVEDTSSSSQGGQDDYVVVERLGQMYNTTITDTNDIRDKIIENLKMQYGYSGKDKTNRDVYDENSVLSSKKPDDVSLKNVKIYFHNKPSLYYSNNGSMRLAPNDEYSSNVSSNRYSLGYGISIMTDASDSMSDIFVNSRGFYQIPDSLNVKALSFSHVGDVVTIEYTLVYHEKNNEDNIVTTSTVDRTVIGQYESVFQPDASIGDSIKSKYNYVSDNKFKQYMQYWKGISIEAAPYTMCSIKYNGADTYTDYLIGSTGVLHMIKGFDIQDLKFLGKRMTIVDKSRQPYLKEWECVYDGAKLTSYPTNPKRNVVYSINDDMRIFYEDGNWYDFAPIDVDSTNIVGNTAVSNVGIAKIPVESQINYYGSVIQFDIL
jgi:hypothetical protein